VEQLVNQLCWWQVQEEGWVVCRAFKKPTPNHRQGFEAWSHAYYVRDHNSQVNRPPSFSDFATTAEVVHPSIQAAATFHDDQQPISSAQQEQLVCSHNVLDSQLIIELPQLGSPTLSTSLATKEGFHHHQHNGVAIEDFDEERSISSQYIDWRNLDNLLASQFPATPSFSHQNLPLISQINELEAQSNACFPDL
jgi:hypothetical protein